MNKSVFIFCQYFLPHHLLSRIIGYLAQTENPWIKNRFIAWFIQKYQVDMTEALKPAPEDYRSFNDFFTRALKPGARTLAHRPQGMISPADGQLTQFGKIRAGELLQAKQQTYSLVDLLAGDQARAAQFQAGSYATIYLSPKDYHRVHMPRAGQLDEMVYVPGKLFSVNLMSADHIPGIFAKNERAICYFHTDQGPMAVILIGAMIVAGIHTVWSGQVCPQGGLRTETYHQAPIQLAQGAEMGRFCLGSSVILLTAEALQFENLRENQTLRLGEVLA